MERDGAELTNIKKNSGAFWAFCFCPSSDAKSEVNRFCHVCEVSSDRRFWLDVVEPDEPPPEDTKLLISASEVLDDRDGDLETAVVQEETTLKICPVEFRIQNIPFFLFSIC